MTSRFIKEKFHVHDPQARKVHRHGDAAKRPSFSLREGNIFFLGPRGSGKTTLALEVASLLNTEMIDTDTEVERLAGCSISDIVSRQGWEAFRDREEEVLRRVCAMPGRAVATGGGIVLREGNRDLLRQSGPVFYLLADVPLLLQRLQAEANETKRPALTGLPLQEELTQTLRERDPLYQECLDFILPAHRTPQELADSVLQTLGIE